MLIRSFRGTTAPQALCEMKRELGPDACVLEVRREGRFVEVLAVAERPSCAERGPKAPGKTVLRPSAARLRDRLETLGFTPVFAERLAASAQENLEPEQLADRARALGYVRDLVRALIPVAPPNRSGKGRLLALVGPSGVGKTTTLLKVAAHERLSRGTPLALASADDRRLGGAAEVEAFARMIDATYVDVAERDDLDGALARVGERGLVLLDTPGVPVAADEVLRRISNLLAGVDRSAVELILAADKDAETLSATVKRFRPLAPGCVGATRLDEAVRPGCLTSVLARTALPLRHLGCGPNVPDDLRIADGEPFAAWAVPGEAPLGARAGGAA